LRALNAYNVLPNIAQMTYKNPQEIMICRQPHEANGD